MNILLGTGGGLAPVSSGRQMRGILPSFIPLLRSSRKFCTYIGFFAALIAYTPVFKKVTTFSLSP